MHTSPQTTPSTITPIRAALWKRLLAAIYDVFILAALSLLYFAIITFVSTVIFNNPAVNFKPNASGIGIQIGWILSLLSFYCFFWMKVGQTVAMKAWRLRLVSSNGKMLTLAQCLLRCSVATLGLACFGLGWLWALIDKQKRTLHDICSGTHVLQLPKGQ